MYGNSSTVKARVGFMYLYIEKVELYGVSGVDVLI